jgi:hypothetical protein
VIRAQVHKDWASFGVTILLTDQLDDDTRPREIFHLISPEGGSPYFKREEIDFGCPVQPTLVLQDDMARALLDALMHHYQGAEDTRAVRRDYDAERARVDKLTDALISLADKLADPA